MLKPQDHLVNDEKFKKENNLSWKEPFYFVQAADSQFGLIRRWEYIEPGLKEGKKGWIDGPIKEWEREKELSENLVELVNNMNPKPKFMIICGDMLDQFPFKIDENYLDGTMTDELDPYRQKQYDDFIKIYSKLNIPLVCVCGNHDMGDKMTILSVKRYEQEFGSNYFKFYIDGVLFICLNSQLYFDPNECEQLAEEQESWLDNILEKESKEFKHIIVLQHHPIFTENIDEEKTYFNLPIDIRKKLVHKFRKAGISYLFCGHYHRNMEGKYEDFNCITTSAIGLQLGDKNDNGFRVVKCEENEIKHRYYRINDQPKLLNF